MTATTESRFEPALPANFLLNARPGITAERIDFSKTCLPEYTGLYAVTLDNALTHDECRSLLHGAEATASEPGWERAMVNVGGGRQQMYEDIRKCGRIIWDSQDIASRVWDRVKNVPEVSDILRLDHKPRITGTGPSQRDEIWVLTRPNERMRFLKYVGGEYFKEHCDGSYETPDGKERSYVTMHLYLNDTGMPPTETLEGMSAAERLGIGQTGLVGGATTFHSRKWNGSRLDVKPKAGRVLLFQHRNLMHSGDDVLSGVKYTMRTDLMYALEKNVEGLMKS